MNRPYKLFWFQRQIGSFVKRREIGSSKILRIPIMDERKAEILFRGQKELGLRYQAETLSKTNMSI